MGKRNSSNIFRIFSFLANDETHFGREIQRKLLERGWFREVTASFKKPPNWLVLLVACIFFPPAIMLLWRLPLSVVSEKYEDLSKMVVGLVGLFGAPFLVWRTWIANEKQRTAEETHYTSLLKNAVDQLGAMRDEGSSTKVRNIEHRIGAIYALEKLASEYQPLHWPIMEILCTYIRENAGEPRPVEDALRTRAYVTKYGARTGRFELKERSKALKPPRADVQTALTVIGRRSDQQRKWEKASRLKARHANQRVFVLDLTFCQLARANLRSLHFERVDFSGSCLEQASLDSAFLSLAKFDDAYLEGASLSQATMICVSATRSHFEGATLSKANFKLANLYGSFFDAANMRGGILRCANLSRASLQWSRMNNTFLTRAVFDNADLKSARLHGSELSGARLHGANLTDATGLTESGLESALGDESTQLPKELLRPKNWL